MNTLLAIDTHSLVYRALYANPREAPNILHGLLKSVIASTRPTHVIAALDGPRDQLERRRMYPPYKSSRKPLDPEKLSALQRCLEYISATGMQTVLIPRWEADDVLATLVDICAGPSCRCVVATSDKDMGQLVGKYVELFDGKHFIDIAAVHKRWDVSPEQLPEVQALCGDTADDIPGVPGVGPKTAAKWVHQFGSARATYENRAALTPSKRKAMEGYDCDLSLELVTLRRDLDIRLDASALRWNGLDMIELESFFDGWQMHPA